MPNFIGNARIRPTPNWCTLNACSPALKQRLSCLYVQSCLDLDP